MTTITRESLLAQIAQIQFMEPGKLCIIRQGPKDPDYNLQCRQQGKTHTQYVPSPQLELAQTHTANFLKFQSLMDQYVQLIADQSRAIRQGHTQKKTTPPSSPLPKPRKSTS